MQERVQLDKETVKKLRVAREEAIRLLYNVEFMSISLEESIESLGDHSKEAEKFAAEVLSNLPKIDKIISDNLENYTIGRLNAVDRAIIRLAVSELLASTPKEVVINEAIELTKSYTDLGDKKACRFNNKLLDKIANSL